jgi:hypothetical protein
MARKRLVSKDTLSLRSLYLSTQTKALISTTRLALPSPQPKALPPQLQYRITPFERL